MRFKIRRVGQLLSQGPDNLLWLIYTVGIDLWVHHVAVLAHELYRRSVRYRRNNDTEVRIAALKRRFAQCASSSSHSHQVALAALNPELDEICRPLRPSQEEITLADVDQDGFLAPRFASLWESAPIRCKPFLQRRRFEITVVDRNGWVGVRKNFRGNRTAFVNELEAVLDLAARGCNVPEVINVDFDRPSITFAYIDGVVVREALARAGAALHTRDLPDLPAPYKALCRISAFWRVRMREASGRRLIDRVLDKATISRIETELLAIHRAGYGVNDIKYGNIIIQSATRIPYFVDFEHALPLDRFTGTTARYLRDRDSTRLNRLFGTDLLTAKGLRRSLAANNSNVYAPFYVGSGVHWGAFWNPDLGILRWRHMLAKHVPVPAGGRVLDLGANNGFNALQMLRAGAAEVVAVEIDPVAIEQGLFVKRIFEWADNTKYGLSYIRGSHADVGSMALGRFDLVTAFCTLYYLSEAAMEKTVAYLASMTDVLVLQCNEQESFERLEANTYKKASLQFNAALISANGFPSVTAIRRSGSRRPLVIGRTGPPPKPPGEIAP